MDNGAVNCWSQLQPGSASTHPFCIAYSHNCGLPGGTGRLLWSPMAAAWWRRETEWESEEVSVRWALRREEERKSAGNFGMTAAVTRQGPTKHNSNPAATSQIAYIEAAAKTNRQVFQVCPTKLFSGSPEWPARIWLVYIPPGLKMPMPAVIFKNTRIALTEWISY